MRGPDPNRGTVLIIDDAPSNLGVMSDFLTENGFRVLVAANGEEGLSHAALGRPDLILLDILMPGMDGFGTCRRLKADPATKDIPVIFLSAVAEADNKVRGFDLGAADFITKPFRQEESLARIRTHIMIRRQQRELLELNRRLTDANAALRKEIDDKTRIARQLDEKNQWLRLMADGIPVIVAYVDKSLRYRFVNKSYEEWFGLDPEQVIGRRVPDVLGPEGWAAVRPGSEKALAGTFSVYEGALKDRTGAMRRFYARNVPHLNDAGEALGYFVLADDVTERKKTEDALRFSELKFRSLFDQAGDAIFVHDKDGRFVDVNQKACEILGYSREELLCLGVGDVDPDVEERMDADRFWNPMRQNGKTTFQGRHRGKDGDIFPVEVTLGPITFEGKTYVLAISRAVRKALDIERPFRDIKSP